MYIYTSIYVYVVVVAQDRTEQRSMQDLLASAQTLHLLRPLVLRKCHENFGHFPPLKPALPFVLLNFRLVTHVVLAQSFLHEGNGLYRLVSSFVFKRDLVANLGCVLLGWLFLRARRASTCAHVLALALLGPSLPRLRCPATTAAAQH